MKPKLCIVGQTPLVNTGRETASEFSDKADFMFITSSLEDSLTFLREIEGVTDIVLAGRSITRLNAKHLKIPIIAFHPTLSDLVQAILEAQTFDTRIALALSSDDRDFDFSVLSKAMHVSLFPFFYSTNCEILTRFSSDVVLTVPLEDDQGYVYRSPEDYLKEAKIRLNLPVEP